jgi:hypothetical protein
MPLAEACLLETNSIASAPLQAEARGDSGIHQSRTFDSPIPPCDPALPADCMTAIGLPGVGELSRSIKKDHRPLTIRP